MAFNENDTFDHIHVEGYGGRDFAIESTNPKSLFLFMLLFPPVSLSLPAIHCIILCIVLLLFHTLVHSQSLSLSLASQELQRDIEKHSTGVASVLNLCEVLLHDCDACATDAECDSIQQATRSLDRRWRSICALSMERRLK